MLGVSYFLSPIPSERFILLRSSNSADGFLTVYLIPGVSFLFTPGYNIFTATRFNNVFYILSPVSGLLSS